MSSHVHSTFSLPHIHTQGSCDKRFAPFGLENNVENRRRYRDLMLGAEGFEQYISGVIFHEETLTQKSDDGRSFPEVCQFRNICCLRTLTRVMHRSARLWVLSRE